MSKGTKNQTNPSSAGNLISRDWDSYLVKAVFSEPDLAKDGRSWPELSDAEIVANRSQTLAGVESKIHVLPTPVVTAGDSVKSILTVGKGDTLIRLYPPFPINEVAEASAAFKDTLVPEGDAEIETFRPVPADAVQGLRGTPTLVDGAKWCRALRCDVGIGVDIQKIIGRLIDQICQYTHQWWLRAVHNPFLGSMRLGGSVDLNYRIKETHKYRGARSIESSWYGCSQIQSNLGIGAPLTNGKWLIACDHAVNGRDADPGLLTFYDAFASYMAGHDDKCILNLCIATEILLNKHRLAIERRRDTEDLSRLIRKSPIVSSKISDTLKCLLIDRNHVAHGRPPHLLGRKPGCTLESYISAVRSVVDSYLRSMPLGEWPNIMSLKVAPIR